MPELIRLSTVKVEEDQEIGGGIEGWMEDEDGGDAVYIYACLRRTAVVRRLADPDYDPTIRMVVPLDRIYVDDSLIELVPEATRFTNNYFPASSARRGRKRGNKTSTERWRKKREEKTACQTV